MHDIIASPRTGTDKAAPRTASMPAPRKKNRWSRGFWIRQLHTWHWISSALSLMGLLLFVVTGFTLNHAGSIAASPRIHDGKARLEASVLPTLHAPENGTEAPIPTQARRDASAKTGLSIPATPADWSDGEIYLAMPRPGGDAWISIDRATGAITWETTDRGWIAYLNDLHKGRNTGGVWRAFIDAFVLAATVFVGTGFALLWMHGRHRPATWPVTGLGLLIPFLLALFFIH